jgi:hypothetical protein
MKLSYLAQAFSIIINGLLNMEIYRSIAQPLLASSLDDVSSQFHATVALLLEKHLPRNRKMLPMVGFEHRPFSP